MYKARVQVDAFTGRTAIAVRQDVYAKTMMTLRTALAVPIEERVIKEYKSRQKKSKATTAGIVLSPDFPWIFSSFIVGQGWRNIYGPL